MNAFTVVESWCRRDAGVRCHVVTWREYDLRHHTPCRYSSRLLQCPYTHFTSIRYW